MESQLDTHALTHTPLIPAKAGIQGHKLRLAVPLLDSRLRGNERVDGAGFKSRFASRPNFYGEN
jgi:hypothetical protein